MQAHLVLEEASAFSTKGDRMVARKLFELVGSDPERVFSPYCWRARMALAHKGLKAETIPWRFTEKDAIKSHNADKVPVFIDGETIVADSWEIANYLEDTYPDRPSLFGGEGGRAMARMLNSWGDVLVGNIASLIVTDIHQRLLPEDQVYFRTSREARFGKSLEEVVAGRESRVDAFRKYLDPLRLTLRKQPFIGGASPNYGDYVLFGQFQWARVVSSFQLLKEDDPVYAWRERLLDAFDGMARKSPGYVA